MKFILTRDFRAFAYTVYTMLQLHWNIHTALLNITNIKRYAFYPTRKGMILVVSSVSDIMFSCYSVINNAREYCQQVLFSLGSIRKHDRTRLSHRKAHSFVSPSRDELWLSNIAKNFNRVTIYEGLFVKSHNVETWKTMINESPLTF